MSKRAIEFSWPSFAILALIIVTLIAQAWTTRQDYAAQITVLDARLAQQYQSIEQSNTLRQQLQSIAGATAELAEQGNRNAITIRDQLKAQGIAINPPKSP
ncbi:MAG: hypothetical protein AAF513_09690 [Pseudomonadota bacterium]